MKQELAQDIALMRYSMISPLIVGLPDEYKSKEAYFRAASARGALHPNGSFIHPAPTSIKRWYQHYQKNGFDGLLPSSRSDEGASRKIDPDLGGTDPVSENELSPYVCGSHLPSTVRQRFCQS